MWIIPEVSLYTPSVLCLDEDAELPDLLNQAVHLCFSDAIGLLQRQIYPFVQVSHESLRSQSYWCVFSVSSYRLKLVFYQESHNADSLLCCLIPVPQLGQAASSTLVQRSEELGHSRASARLVCFVNTGTKGGRNLAKTPPAGFPLQPRVLNLHRYGELSGFALECQDWTSAQKLASLYTFT